MDVLIVEDNRVQARIVRRCLTEGRAADRISVGRVTVVPDAEKALKRLRDHDCGFDLLILDWMLPTMSGIEFLRAIRRDESHGDIYVIMQTANDRLEHVEKARRAGVDDYLVKPLDCEALLRKMRRLNASTDTGDADAGDAGAGFDRT